MLIMPSKEELTADYENGKTEDELIAKYFVSRTTLYRWSRKYNLKRNVDYIKKEDLEKLFNEGITYREMAKRLYCDHLTVWKYLVKFGIVEDTNDNRKRKKLTDIKELYELRVNSKWTFEELAELYKVSQRTVQNRCEENSFPTVKVDTMKHTWKMACNKRIWL